MSSTNYHRVLRISAVVCALALVFESGLLSDSTAQMSKNTHSYLANAIGMSAAVRPTELNMYTAQLTAKEQELAAREAALSEREISVDISSGSTNSDTSTYIMASILFILLVLILLNYMLDYLRARDEEMMKTV